MPEEGRDTAGITIRLILAYVRRHLGEAAVGRLLTLAGETRPLEVLEDESVWSSYRERVALLEAAAELTGDDRVAYRIGGSILTEQVGGVTRAVIGALGSPHRVFRHAPRASARFIACATIRAPEVTRGRAVVTLELHEGYPPNRHECLYAQGLLSQVPVLFGRPPATIDHDVCQVDGAARCEYRISWSRFLGRRRARGNRHHHDAASEALREQLTELERTVAELVESDRLDDVLQRLATRAGVAVHAQHHLLAVRLQGEVHVHAAGLDPEIATALGERLVARGTVELPGSAVLVAPIASARQQVGWLAAFTPDDGGFLPGAREHLEAYAGLAAAAVEVATSLWAARSSSEISQALLQLGRQVANEQDEIAIAQRVAETAPVVVGADRVSVFLWDAETERMATAAVHGYGALTEEALAFQIPTGATHELSRMLEDPRPRHYDLGCGDAFIDEALRRFGNRCAFVAPILAQGELIGAVLAARVGEVAVRHEPRHELDALASLADQAATAIARLRLLERMVHIATHDHLTGLPGRAWFTDRLELAIADHERSGRGAAVGFLDLDGFKRVNDTYGHAAGDTLLVEVARRLRRAVRAVDTVARMAGDEFAVLLADIDDHLDAQRVAEKVTAELSRPYHLGAERVSAISASFGLAFLPQDGLTPEALLKAADAAMYRAKDAGGGAYRTTAGAIPT